MQLVTISMALWSWFMSCQKWWFESINSYPTLFESVGANGPLYHIFFDSPKSIWITRLDARAHTKRRREVEIITRSFSMSMNFYFKVDISHGEILLYIECMSFVAIQYQTCILTVETVWIREIKDNNCNFARTKISEWNRMLHC